MTPTRLEDASLPRTPNHFICAEIVTRLTDPVFCHILLAPRAGIAPTLDAVERDWWVLWTILEGADLNIHVPVRLPGDLGAFRLSAALVQFGRGFCTVLGEKGGQPFSELSWIFCILIQILTTVRRFFNISRTVLRRLNFGFHPQSFREHLSSMLFGQESAIFCRSSGLYVHTNFGK